jgi:hypothetical protein
MCIYVYMCIYAIQYRDITCEMTCVCPLGPTKGPRMLMRRCSSRQLLVTANSRTYKVGLIGICVCIKWV